MSDADGEARSEADSDADEAADAGSVAAPSLAALVTELDRLAETAPTAERRERIEEVARLAAAARPEDGVFGQTIVGFDRTDAGEAFVGAVLFGIPMFVESGTAEVAVHLAGAPLSLVATVLATVGLVVGILYVADIQDVRIHRPILGVVPRRLAGVLGIAVLTAAVGLTVWGRLDWTTPTLALAQVAVATLPMSIGAALGDILPGT